MSEPQSFSTDAAQTALAVLALIAAGKSTHPATVQGLQYLIDQQQKDGSWSQNMDLQGTLPESSSGVEESDPVIFSIAQSVCECVDEAETFLFASYKKRMTSLRQAPVVARKRSPHLKIYSPDDQEDERFSVEPDFIPAMCHATPALKLFAE